MSKGSPLYHPPQSKKRFFVTLGVGKQGQSYWFYMSFQKFDSSFLPLYKHISFWLDHCEKLTRSSGLHFRLAKKKIQKNVLTLYWCCKRYIHGLLSKLWRQVELLQSTMWCIHACSQYVFQLCTIILRGLAKSHLDFNPLSNMHYIRQIKVEDNWFAESIQMLSFLNIKLWDY